MIQVEFALLQKVVHLLFVRNGNGYQHMLRLPTLVLVSTHSGLPRWNKHCGISSACYFSDVSEWSSLYSIMLDLHANFIAARMKLHIH